MDPDLSSDQRLLLDSCDAFIRSALPLSAVRALIDSRGDVEPSYRMRAAELGSFAFLAPEDLGGGGVSGDGLLDLAIIAELRGRYLQPGNFIDTNVTVATLTVYGSDEQQDKILPALVAGETAAAWVVADDHGDWSGSAVSWLASADGYRLNGRASLIVDAHAAELLLVTTRGPDGPTQFLVPTSTPGVTLHKRTGFDLTRRFFDVQFDDVDVDVSAMVGGVGHAAGAVERQLQIASVLSAAEAAGAMQHVFELSVQYSKDRIAFGRPIGSFQALKHQLADTSLAVELSHACVTGAARTVQDDGTGAGEAASMTKALVGDAAVEVAHKSWQIFGGISYTWEHDFHLYLRRLTTDAALYGTSVWHRERVCQLAGVQ